MPEINRLRQMFIRIIWLILLSCFKTDILGTKNRFYNRLLHKEQYTNKIDKTVLWDNFRKDQLRHPDCS
jgi:hypothetical protein